MKFLKTKEAKNAFGIGAICFLGYMTCYLVKNLLGVASPYMIEEGFYDIQYIGMLSTVLYAPIMKVIAENTRSVYAIRCSLGITFSVYGTENVAREEFSCGHGQHNT